MRETGLTRPGARLAGRVTMMGPGFGGGFRPTHRVGRSPLGTYAQPDAATSTATPLDPHLEVQLVEQQANGWARVVCSNGWSTWVDARLLVLIASAAAQPAAQG